jgi:uncharacterized membrane protein YkvA (DUF1232 family)
LAENLPRLEKVEVTLMSFSIQSLYNWYRNTVRNPKYRWWVVLATVVYLLSPFDISPDFLPIVGQIDDIAVATLLISELSQMAIEYFKSRQSHQGNNKVPGVYESENPTTNPTVDVETTPIE